MGRRAYRRGASPQARDSRVAPDRQAVHAVRERAAPVTGLAGLGNVCPESCAGDARVRFLGRGHGDISDHLRLRRDGYRYAPDRALEHDGASDGHSAAVSHDRGRDLPHRFVLYDRDSIYAEGVDRRDPL